MKLYFCVKGFKDVEYGFPIDGIQLQLTKDLGEYEGLDLSIGTDIFLDIDSAEYGKNGNCLDVKCIPCSIMLDGNETDLETNSNLVYDIIRASKLTEIIISGDYCGNQKLLSKLEVVGSMKIKIGDSLLHRKVNKVKFY